jgi:ankyrin repeat protein
LRLYRILQRIESKPNKKISIKVQRLLKWILAAESYTRNVDTVLTAAALTHAISVEAGDKSLDWDRIPEVTDIFAMLSSLVKHKPDEQGRVQLSHFTVKEFLTSSEAEIAMQSDVPTAFVHKYLVSPQKDLDYLIDTSLTYLTFRNLHQPPMESPDIAKGISELTFYRYAASGLSYLFRDYDSSREETEPFKRFFTVTPTQAYMSWLELYALDFEHPRRPSVTETLPLHYACVVALEQTCKRLREEGADLEMRTPPLLTPLHLAINGSWDVTFHKKVGDGDTKSVESHQVRAIRRLVENNNVNSGADLGSTTEISLQYTAGTFRNQTKPGINDVLHASPLCLAILRNKPDICECLLSMGASLDRTAAGLGEDFITIKAICKRLPPPSAIGDHMKAVLRRIISEAGLEDEIPSIKLLDVVAVSRLGGPTHITHTLRAHSLGALGEAILQRDINHVMYLISKQIAVADHRHALLACQCKMWDAVSIFQEQNVFLTDADNLSVYEAYPKEARKKLGRLGHRDINVPREKVVQLFRDNFVNFASEFPDLQEMQFLLSRLNPQEYVQTIGRMTSLTTINAPKAVRFMLSNNLLDAHKIKSMLLECCIWSPTIPENRSLETLKALTEHSIDLNVLDTKAAAPLHLAVQSRFLNHVRLLLNGGATPDHCDKRGCTALHYAVLNSPHGGPSKEIVKDLLSIKFGAKSLVTRQAFDGSTALHLAAKEPEGLTVLKFLLKVVEFRNTKDGCGATALYHAAAGGNHEAVRLLLKGQIFPLVGIDDQSDLHGSPLYAATLFAAQNDSINTSIKLLLEAGADVNIAGHGQPLGPPLFVAAIYGSRSLMRLFFNHGADIMSGSRRYRSLIHLATDLRRPDILLLLQDKITKSVTPKNKVNISSQGDISSGSGILDQLERSTQAMIAQLDTSRQAMIMEGSPSDSSDETDSDTELPIEDSNLTQDVLEAPLAEDYQASDSSSWITCYSRSSSVSTGTSRISRSYLASRSSSYSSLSKRSTRETRSQSSWVRFKNAVFYRRHGRPKYGRPEYKLRVAGTANGTEYSSLVDD